MYVKESTQLLTSKINGVLIKLLVKYHDGTYTIFCNVGDLTASFSANIRRGVGIFTGVREGVL